MTIIISKNGKDAKKVESSGFDYEDNLQAYIDDNPNAIPMYEIKEDARVLVLAREFSTQSGPIDALGIDQDGEIYIIETKLYKNSDKRTVCAQALDYGASLWKSSVDFSDFIYQIDNYLSKKEGTNCVDKIKSFFELESADDLLERVKDNLNHGNFKFIVLMDQLDNRLKDLILFINENSKFDIYAVEFQYYKYEEMEIIIPKLYGAEVKKDISISQNKTSILTDTDFINAYGPTPYKQIVDSLIALREKNESEVYFTGKYLNIKTKTLSGRAVTCNIHIEPGYEGGGIQFWCDKEDEEKVREILSSLNSVIVLPELKTKHGKVARWPFDYYNEDDFKSILGQFSNL